MKFQTRYDREPTKKEVNSGKNIVERQGYISNKARVENLLNAGKRLDTYRREMYDFTDSKNIDENFIDPTRKKSFDFAEAHKLAFETQGKLEEQKIIAKETTAARKAVENLIVEPVKDPE